MDLLDSDPYFLWRDTSQKSSPTFFERSFAGKDRTSKYPAYQVIDARLDGQSISVCISCSELLRFFVGQSPALSRRLYGFTETLSNPNLYRYEGDSFLEGKPSRVEIADKNLGEQGKKLLFAMLTDPVGRLQLLSVARSARAAYARNSSSNESSNGIYPVFGLPYAAASSLQITGEFREICILGEHDYEVKPVFAVTSIEATGHQPESYTADVVFSAASGRNPKKIKTSRRNRNNDIPRDTPEASNTDQEILSQMGADIGKLYMGLDEIEVVETPVYKKDGASHFAISDYEDPENLIGLSTERGTDTDGKIGRTYSRDDEAGPAIEKSLLLIQDGLEDLLNQNAECVFDLSDIEFVEYENLPKEFKLLASCMGAAKSSMKGQYDVSYLGGEVSTRVPLIDMGRFSSAGIVKETGRPRRALAGLLRCEDHTILLADIERVSGEHIGIYTLLVPTGKPLSWPQVSFILQHRLDPSAGMGSWPSPKSHNGGYVAKVQPHRMYWDNKEFIFKRLDTFRNKLVAQREYISLAGGF